MSMNNNCTRSEIRCLLLEQSDAYNYMPDAIDIAYQINEEADGGDLIEAVDRIDWSLNGYAEIAEWYRRFPNEVDQQIANGSTTVADAVAYAIRAQAMEIADDLARAFAQDSIRYIEEGEEE